MILDVKGQMMQLLQDIKARSPHESNTDTDDYLWGLQGEVEKIRHKWHKKWDRLLDHVRSERRKQMTAESAKIEEGASEPGNGEALSKKSFDRTAAVEQGRPKVLCTCGIDVQEFIYVLRHMSCSV